MSHKFADNFTCRLFDRGANCVGLDFLAHPFWDKYVEFEERLEGVDKIFAVLGRIIHIPMHQYARYFERYRQLAQSRPINELAPAETILQFRAEVEGAAAGVPPGSRSEAEVDRDIRLRVDGYHLEVFSTTQTETTKRWTYESEIKRPYFHVTELDEPQLANWRKYLDFEEAEGAYARIQFLYERCLVTCAHYDEFWMRYARWMSAQEGKEEEVRIIYQRASTVYVPISRPETRLHYAYFEEMAGRVDVAKDIHDAILISMPGHIETIVSFANLCRRHGGLDTAIEVYKSQIDSQECDIQTKSALVAEWAKLLWKIKGNPAEAREVFQKNQQWYLDSRPFWTSYLMFELEQPTSAETESAQYERIHQVIEDLRIKSSLPAAVAKDLIMVYMMYLLERGSKDAVKEYITLDREVNGPPSVQAAMKPDDEAQKRAKAAEALNGQHTPAAVPALPVSAAVTPTAVPVPTPQADPYQKYYQQAQIPVDPQHAQQLPSNGNTWP